MEETKQIFNQNLSIHPKYCSDTSINQILECFLCGKWIRSVNQELRYMKPPSHPHLSPDEVHSALQLGENIGEFWQRILIQLLPKEPFDVFTIPRISNVLQPHLANNLSYSQLLHYVSASNIKNLWKDSYQRFDNHAIIKQWKEGQRINVEPQRKGLKNALFRLYKCPIIPLNDEIDCENNNQNLSHQNVHSHIHPAFFIIEGTDHYFVFMEPSSYSVWDCVNFSPSKLKENESGALFILYQLLEGMQIIQDCGLFLGNISLHHLRLGADFHLTVIPQIADSLLKPDTPSDSSDCSKDSTSKRLIEGTSQHGASSPKDNADGYLDHVTCHEVKKVIKQFQPHISGAGTTFESLQSSLLQLTQKWVAHEIPNFDYLLCLSYFAGHSYDSPVFYPTLPWVTDFTVPNGGWRDLTKSKYRLNKGDQQLDHTYELAETGPHHDQIAHHIPEFFSEVTYYVYKARVTPKQILQKHVRQQFVASHYPSSIARMYALTPEECIPEFYCDPSVFKSIHDDLTDLEVPLWCEGVEDFLRMHRVALESNYVSRRLHHWIDLYYGYKLTGSASVKAKNVCLPLVDDHTSLSKGGIVQLFNIPHPPKLTPSPFLSRSPPHPYSSGMKEVSALKQSRKGLEGSEELSENVCKEENAENLKEHLGPSKQSKSSTQEEKLNANRIELPINYNPLTSLNQVEMLYNFFLKTTGKLPDKMDKGCSSLNSVKQTAHMQRVRDIQVLGCLIVQIFSSSRCRIVNSKASLQETYNLSMKILQELSDIPKCLHHALKVIFQMGETKLKTNHMSLPSKFSPVTEDGLPPPSSHQMLQPLINIISFPIYFSRLSSFINNMKGYSRLLQEVLYICDDKKEEVSQQMVEKHIRRTARDLQDLIPHLSLDGLKLILSHVIELYKNPLSAVCAAWHLTDLISQALGSSDINKHILPLLVKLFEVDSVSNSHFKLFHQTFLLQLMVRLGLGTFLKYFITPIIEGAGGYKAPVERSKQLAVGVLKQSKILRNARTGFEMEEPAQLSPSGDNLYHQSNSDSLERNKYLKRQSSSLRSPSGAETDITDAENDTEIFVFEGGEEDDTLNDFGGTPTLDMNDSLKSPVSDTVSLDEESLQEGGGSIPSLCPSPHSPTLSGEETEEHVSNEDPFCSSSTRQTDSSSFSIPIPYSKLLGVSPKCNVYSTSLPDKALDTRTYYSAKDANKEVKETKPFRENEPTTRDSSSIACSDYDSSLSLAEICCESILWLSHRLGPVLTARHLTRNLLRMLSLCYLPESGSLTPLPLNPARNFSVTKKEIVGDDNATRILRCLSEIADLYGEQVILLQYLSHITELVNWCGSKLNTSQEAGLISAMTLLQHLLLKLSDVTFMDYLQETLIRNALYPVIRLLSSVKVYFPNGPSVRTILAWRVIDSLCIMVRRVGREMSKEKLTPAITRFLTAFDKVHSTKWQAFELLKAHDDLDKEEKSMEGKSKAYDSSQDNKERVLEELRKVFTPELAYLSYVPLCRFLGTKYMEDSLPNHDLLRSLCLQYDESNQADYAAVLMLDGHSNLELVSGSGSSSTVAANAAVTGNRIDIKDSTDNILSPSGESSPSFDLESSFNISKYVGNKMENNLRHLRGNWLAYWEHEIGRSDHEESFNFKQIKLQNFIGHSNSVKSIYVLDNENSFISCSKDKTVKLWSLRSQGDGNAECGPQWTYSNHKKSVFDVAFCEPLCLAASCDSVVHIWDPFTGTCLKQLDSLRHSPVTVLTAMSSPSTQLITATTDSTLKFIDLRTCNYTHELKITTNSVGLVRCLSTSSDSHLVAVAHSSGVIATLDLRTGQLLATWKPHEGEVLTLQWYQKGTFVSSALDQTICVWSVYDNKLKFLLKGPTEPVHLLRMFGDEVLTGTTANRIGLHTAVSPNTNFSCTRLRTDAFKGVLTSMAVLAMNRQLLLGADNGSIKLLC